MPEMRCDGSWMRQSSPSHQRVEFAGFGGDAAVTLKPMKLWEVVCTCDGKSSTSLVNARTRSGARYALFMDLDMSIKFTEFLKWYCPRPRLRATAPEQDGYAYVRRVYGLSPHIGQRARLKNEGDWTGKEGVVLYPGTSSAHVHILLDGQKHASICHPHSVELLP